MDIKSAGKTDIGLVRKGNEDCIKVYDEKQLYIVCDGMGGHQAGEVASRTACELVTGLYSLYFDQLHIDENLKLPRVFPSSTDVLAKSVRIANHWIHTRAASDPSLSGMGTTIAAVTIEEDIITLLHVGDSRIYRYYDSKLSRLTIDHSWAAEIERSENISAEEAQNLVNRNVITRALGVKEKVEIDIGIRRLTDGEIYILCSDGLCGLVDDRNIERVTASCRGDVQTIASELIELANGWGGVDNISVVAVKIEGNPPASGLSELETVTLNEEPSEYLPVEKEWAQKAERPINTTAGTTGSTSKSGVFSFFATIVILVVIVAIFYLIIRG